MRWMVPQIMTRVVPHLFAMIPSVVRMGSVRTTQALKSGARGLIRQATASTTIRLTAGQNTVAATTFNPILGTGGAVTVATTKTIWFPNAIEISALSLGNTNACAETTSMDVREMDIVIGSLALVIAIAQFDGA